MYIETVSDGEALNQGWAGYPECQISGNRQEEIDPAQPYFKYYTLNLSFQMNLKNGSDFRINGKIYF